MTFEVPTSLSHLSFHLRLWRVNTLFVLSGGVIGYGCLHNLQHLVLSWEITAVTEMSFAGETSGRKSLLIPDGNLGKHGWWRKRASAGGGGRDRTSRLFSGQSLTESRVRPVDASSFGIRHLSRGDWNDYEFMTKMAEGGNMVSRRLLSPLGGLNWIS